MPNKIKSPPPARESASDWPPVDPDAVLRSKGRNRFLVLLWALQEKLIRKKRGLGGKWDRGHARRDKNIRERRARGDRVTDIARDEGLSRERIYKILSKK